MMSTMKQAIYGCMSEV